MIYLDEIGNVQGGMAIDSMIYLKGKEKPLFSYQLIVLALNSSL